MTEPVVRETLLKQSLTVPTSASAQMRRITLQPGVVGGPHHHDGPVLGVVETGSAIFQVDGGEETIVRSGDAFYEPAGVLIDRFDATDEGVTFVATFLTTAGSEPRLTAGRPDRSPVVTPVLEHVVLPVLPGLEAEFEAAFAEARPLLEASPGFRRLTLSRGIETPNHYLLLVEWDSVDDHEVDFRGSPAYDRWRALLHEFYAPFPTVAHFTAVIP